MGFVKQSERAAEMTPTRNTVGIWYGKYEEIMQLAMTSEQPVVIGGGYETLRSFFKRHLPNDCHF